jgi:superfamily II DNA helicase RecQ
MPYRHFQIPCSGGEIEAAMTQFLNQHRVLKVEKQFVEAGLDSFWAYQIHYDDALKPALPPGISVAGKKGLIDYKAILNGADFSLFLKLKEWRKARAGKDAVEPFTIFTNAQLADVAQRRCATLEALREISGIGDARIERYADAVLGLMKEAPAP